MRCTVIKVIHDASLVISDVDILEANAIRHVDADVFDLARFSLLHVNLFENVAL